MKNILIFGAGQSAPYLISYLLNEAQKNNWFVTVGDMDEKTAKAAVNGHPHGNGIEFDVNDMEKRHSLIQKSDVVVNFLTPTFQYLIALDCVRFGKHVITASYENPRVAELSNDAQSKGILILNEMGLDPGIDHMSAMQIITRIRENNGTISSFISYGSGIPAPEVKSNPLNYCITWNPSNVVTAGDAGAQYLEDGKIKLLPHHEVFRRTWDVEIENLGMFEAYPNRDSLLYQKIFNLKKVNTMIRGTLRYPGWSETWYQIVKLGLYLNTLTLPEIAERSYRDFTEMFLPLNVSGPKLEARIANYLNISPTGSIMKNLSWLGLFSNEKIGKNFRTPMDLMTDLIKKKMPLPEGQRDMVILHHEIIAEYKDQNKKEKIVSTLVEYGDPKEKFTAIAKTVGAPAAIAAKLVLKGELNLTGCHIPTHPAIYTKVLEELATLGIKFNEKTEEIN
ncbi:MAG: saccharopine dehydrogenase NADP-binding domain-containing protein [Ignavibacteriae bacterium]|nr:saccharopine dehydrogenase NADP-binding domain-containing protein [Ignavibacteriota bacterium]MCB9209457.1 saccharopine dehydrogenase NADP-binding domain-containing protein [Ignavibacteriales bacterium]MCB9258100.1 saccharopine dehydrogenase NADP-binding domain-containing protein [Ignavibacteriales bacterium]